MKQLIISLLIVSFALVSCSKSTLAPASINGEQQFSNATTGEIITNQKAGINGYYPRQSDTMYAARTPNYCVLFNGNSLISNWRYYNWEKTWGSLPIVNRAVAGKTDKERMPYLQQIVYDYTPKVWIYYGEENMFLRAADAGTSQWTALSEAVKYFDSTYNMIRRRYPNLRMIVHSMMTCPSLYNRQFSPAIDSFNVYLKAKVLGDKQGINRWVDIRQAISYEHPEYYRTDGIHISETTPAYSIWASILKPVVTEVYNAADSVVTPPPVVVPPPPVDTMIVNVPGDLNPIANAGKDFSIGLSWNYTPWLYGTTSTDADGWISKFKWILMRGPNTPVINNPTGGKTSLGNLSIGTYTFRVVVTDNKGATGVDEVNLTVTK